MRIHIFGAAFAVLFTLAGLAVFNYLIFGLRWLPEEGDLTDIVALVLGVSSGFSGMVIGYTIGYRWEEGKRVKASR